MPDVSPLPHGVNCLCLDRNNPSPACLEGRAGPERVHALAVSADGMPRPDPTVLPPGVSCRCPTGDHSPTCGLVTLRVEGQATDWAHAVVGPEPTKEGGRAANVKDDDLVTVRFEGLAEEGRPCLAGDHCRHIRAGIKGHTCCVCAQVTEWVDPPAEVSGPCRTGVHCRHIRWGMTGHVCCYCQKPIVKETPGPTSAGGDWAAHCLFCGWNSGSFGLRAPAVNAATDHRADCDTEMVNITNLVDL